MNKNSVEELMKTVTIVFESPADVVVRFGVWETVETVTPVRHQINQPKAIQIDPAENTVNFITLSGNEFTYALDQVLSLAVGPRF